MTAPTLIEIALDYLRTVSDLSEDQLRGYLTGWTLVPYKVKSRIAGLALMRGTEIHFLMRPESRRVSIWRDAARTFIRPLLEKHGALTTRVRVGDEASKRFVTRFGFEPTTSDGEFEYFALSALPFERK